MMFCDRVRSLHGEKMMLRGSSALLAILFGILAVPALAEESVTIEPARDNSMLLNPGKGWVQYYGADKYTKDYISVGYTRWAWSVLQPKEDHFNWKEIDAFIRQFKQYGKKTAFGVMSVSTGSGSTSRRNGSLMRARPRLGGPGRLISYQPADHPEVLGRSRLSSEAQGIRSRPGQTLRR